MGCITNTPPTGVIERLIGRLEEYAGDIERLYEELSEAIDDYVDDTDDRMSEMECYLDDMSDVRKINEMLYAELNAGRKELLSLAGYLEENGIPLPETCHIDHRRLDPGSYEQDSGCPFYCEDPDEHFKALLQSQYHSLLSFEDEVPMTVPERKALHAHLLLETGLDPNGRREWMAFLRGFRARTNEGRKGNAKGTDMYHNRSGYKGTAGNVRMGKPFYRFQSSDRPGMGSQSAQFTDTGADVTGRIAKEWPQA